MLLTKLSVDGRAALAFRAGWADELVEAAESDGMHLHHDAAQIDAATEVGLQILVHTATHRTQ